MVRGTALVEEAGSSGPSGERPAALRDLRRLRNEAPRFQTPTPTAGPGLS